MFVNLQADHCWWSTVAYWRTSSRCGSRDAAARALEDGSFQRCGLVLLVDTRTLNSRDRLTQLNLSLRSLWSSTTVVIKPWSGGIERAED